MKYRHFSVEERETIQLMWWERRSARSIAQALNRSPSSVSRELRRSFPEERQVYTPRIAHDRALEKRKNRGRKDRLKNQTVRDYAINHLKEGWSPEQISGRIKIELGEKISHEAIYQYIYSQIHRQGCGTLKPGSEDLRPYLRRRHKRRGQKGMRTVQRVFRPKGPSIEDRPLIVNQRLRLGDWESDTIASKDNAPGLNSLVERKSGLVLLTKVKDKTSEATKEVIVRRLSDLPCHTITFDNGAENQKWPEVQEAIKTRCFFTHPYHSWERGANENTNGLVRCYFPKGTDFRTIPDEAVKTIEEALNTRPRKRLNWFTPLEAFLNESTESVALTD
ncbi:MAG: hypothetical protein A2734_00195 [Parcubacteria group bacterium RIFCSPHIGHO2_01_FULL_40_30]|nr:MAG: hypothetical protein A2734_00195 [Parcubacteria group bacterium RIFCSPHIGHO2_01_FULL_40_30]OHB22494.1 MAG: hypothetical protein A3I22_02760 [Parcubacteria group bacterium RIFCSPLOWO2_02_FULL_40_12]